MSLVEITEKSHGVLISIAYATSNNFTGKPIYRRAGCYLHADAAERLKDAVEQAAVQGFRILIFDAFRPAEAQWKMWDHTPDPEFLADPRRGSPHSRGVAVDLTLIDSAGRALEMGTRFDAFTPRSHHANRDVSAEAQRNRLLLLGLMTSAGWDFYRNEWWHYQLFNSRSYPLFSDSILPEGML